jgi:hypothetical protein
MLQKAAYPLQCWKRDHEGTRSLQQAVVKHQHAVPTSASFQSSALQLQGTPHASKRQEKSLHLAGNESSSHREAIDDFPKGKKVEPDQMGAGEGESMGQHSNQTDFQCWHDAVAGRFRTLAQREDELQTSIEELASICLDTVPEQPSVPAYFHASRLRDRQESSSHGDGICCSEHDSNAVGEHDAHEDETVREGVSRLKDTGRRETSTCSSRNAVGMRNTAVKAGLLGESGQVIKEAREALKEIEDVHSSDGLMHSEFFGPFWELSEV